jgi:hypothetical protein
MFMHLVRKSAQPPVPKLSGLMKALCMALPSYGKMMTSVLICVTVKGVAATRCDHVRQRSRAQQRRSNLNNGDNKTWKALTAPYSRSYSR